MNEWVKKELIAPDPLWEDPEVNDSVRFMGSSLAIEFMKK